MTNLLQNSNLKDLCVTKMTYLLHASNLKNTRSSLAKIIRTNYYDFYHRCI